MSNPIPTVRTGTTWRFKFQKRDKDTKQKLPIAASSTVILITLDKDDNTATALHAQINVAEADFGDSDWASGFAIVEVSIAATTPITHTGAAYVEAAEKTSGGEIYPFGNGRFPIIVEKGNLS